ncbi:hypothetical protein BDV26DRAFT_83325 [Aspergillus bertholletiae]|uniref:Uncharacterized protein n=1 Tax=Aspergillus bertholletiae TaxID=1226010 RepID=A0A5N7AUV7_9EURO|nr:hypothetical protein BDV26DRAFT_83325 [Aspergillus bertholletiae]
MLCPAACLIGAVAAAYDLLHCGTTESAQHCSYNGPDSRVCPTQSILRGLDVSPRPV